ncbi:protein CHUP1, chloroplastic [Nicotiana tomentosiformis]|uniref:protein CHUP1, chloroplastic n=1 Tax=Nicotiana tomentosiformis TaxID=4098 RepID=UPI00051C55F9|nr:protein CHUP1, chloroplastic isoform X1 [Nicotiana tomentosiformis]XP_033516787.1 protein CHUP1, chloroplastic isoform X2 [Nicotiana tomentosiformis]
MESNSTKVEMIKPVFLKAGIPIAITLTGYIIAKITTKRSSILTHSTNQENSQEIITDQHDISRDEVGLNQNLDYSEYEDDHSSTHTIYKDSAESFHFQDKCKFEEDLLSLRRRTDDIEEREHQLEARFQQYTHLKDQEIALMDMQNKLLLEINKIEFFDKEITLMEGENQRFQNMVIEYLRIMELLDLSQSENKLLHKKVKKLLKKIKEHSIVLKEQNFQLEAKETEISRNQQGLEMKDHIIKKMELHIEELKMAIEQLQEEKTGLHRKLEVGKNSNPSKNDVEVVTVEDYKELANELEQLQKDKATEDKELIYLRWCNACLRHELMRRNQEQMEQEKNHDQELNLGEENTEIVTEFVPKHELIMRRSSSMGHNESCLSSPINEGHSNDHSKRRKLIQKFKKWVEGSDKMKHETNCFKRQTVSDCTEELMIPARKSCSSA